MCKKMQTVTRKQEKPSFSNGSSGSSLLYDTEKKEVATKLKKKNEFMRKGNEREEKDKNKLVGPQKLRNRVKKPLNFQLKFRGKEELLDTICSPVDGK